MSHELGALYDSRLQRSSLCCSDYKVDFDKHFC